MTVQIVIWDTPTQNGFTFSGIWPVPNIPNVGDLVRVDFYDEGSANYDYKNAVVTSITHNWREYLKSSTNLDTEARVTTTINCIEQKDDE